MKIVMNTSKNIIARILNKFKWQTFKENSFNIVLTTGLIGLSTVLYFHNVACTKTINDGLPSIMNNRIQSNVHNNFIVGVTLKCAPSVVSIEIKNSKLFSPQTGEPRIISTGSGFVVKDGGWIMTNAHVIMNKPNAIINIITTAGDTYEATVEDIDLKLDLALLKINSHKLHALALGRSENITPGEWVVALGSPLALRNTITAGVVSSIDREAKDLGISNMTTKYIQTDAAITFGHSGGPLVNLSGEVIGVNNLKITSGIAFAIPIDCVKEFLIRSSMCKTQNEKIQASMKRPPFGITMLAISKESITELFKKQNLIIPINISGVLVYNVVEQSPAHLAGLLAGDILTHINNIPISNGLELYAALSLFENKIVQFTLFRQGIQRQIYYKLLKNNI